MIFRSFFLCLLTTILLISCASQIGPITNRSTPVALHEIVYDGAITLSVKNGQTLAGTNIGYAGKTSDGRAIVTVGGVPAPKSTADSVNFTGAPAPNALITLNTRVTSYDTNAVNLLGTIHVTIKDPQPQPGEPAPEGVAAFGIPVSYNLNRNDTLPGTLIHYLGSKPEGAQFDNVEGFPFRQQFDSVVWSGHLRDKIGLRLELRVVNFSEDSATLVGIAQLRFER